LDAKNQTAISYTNNKYKTGLRNRSSTSFMLPFPDNNNRYFFGNILESLCSTFTLKTRRINQTVYGIGKFSDLYLWIFGYGARCQRSVGKKGRRA
jgi:hypothetical protein